MVKRIFARSGKNERHTDGDDESVVLPVNFANPVALLAGDRSDGDGHARSDE
jgi:hypothetical protein